MNQLMIHVEKVVRPVRASLELKMKMREELLSHLQGIYDEEIEQSKDRDAAIRVAMERFGSPDQVTRSLQGTVPWHSSALWHFYRGFTRDHECRATVQDATWWMIRRMFGLWIVAGSLWLGFRIWLDRLQWSEAVGIWSAFMICGLLFAWPLCEFVASHVGILGRMKSPRRAFVFGLATWGAFMTLPTMLYAVPWFGPAVRASSLGNTSKLFMVGLLVASILAVLAILLRSKKCAALIDTDAERVTRAREWELLDLSA